MQIHTDIANTVDKHTQTDTHTQTHTHTQGGKAYHSTRQIRIPQATAGQRPRRDRAAATAPAAQASGTVAAQSYADAPIAHPRRRGSV